MAEGVHTGTSLLLPAQELARTLVLKQAPNGIRYASFGETKVADVDLDRVVQAVPMAMAPALADRAFYFVPLALAEVPDRKKRAPEETLVATVYSAELADEAICHRNVTLQDSPAQQPHEGVFISARLLEDNFALAFEFFINVGHAFAAAAGIPEAFSALAWSQALAGVRGETSQDAWEARTDALAGHKPAAQPGRTGDRRAATQVAGVQAQDHHFDEKSKNEFLDSAFADALAIYQLSLAVDFDYSELREREYPLLAAPALAERLRLMARLFPPSEGYEFAIKYRRRT